jgi:hypothetical protein
MISVLALLFLTIAAGYAAGSAAARRERGRPSDDRELRDLRERLGRLEQSMETTAAELERVTESERFLTALLEDRTKSSRALERPGGEAPR